MTHLAFTLPSNERALRDDEAFARFWALAFILLVCVSYRLWLPSQWTATSYYPSIAFAETPQWLASGVSMLLMPLFAAASAAIILFPRTPWCLSTAWSFVAVGLVLAFLTDQHRLQPWAYQTFLYAAMFVLLPVRLRMLAFRIITISIYFYSSIGKFDFQFVHTVGQEFLLTAASLFHLDINQWSDRSRVIAAAGFPAAELSIAILLMIPWTRRFGGRCAIAMHVALIALLSPWGMGHSAGVMMWNAVLAGQAYCLFVRPTHLQNDAAPVAGIRVLGVIIAASLLLMALVLPLTERRDRYDSEAWHWDHWTSWALYSPHNSRVDIEIYSGVIDSLPPSIASAVAPDENGDSWHNLELGRLSLDSRGVPISPQARYQLQLAIAIAEAQGWSHEIRGVVRSAADRRDGSRTEIWVNGIDAMQDASSR